MCQCVMWSEHTVSGNNVVSAQCCQCIMWSEHTVSGYNVVSAQCCQCIMWSEHTVSGYNVVSAQCGQCIMWSEHTVSGYNVVSAQCDQCIMWSERSTGVIVQCGARCYVVTQHRYDSVQTVATLQWVSAFEKAGQVTVWVSVLCGPVPNGQHLHRTGDMTAVRDWLLCAHLTPPPTHTHTHSS